MSKLRLQVDYDYEFWMAGIVCGEHDYRLCWKLNDALNLQLAKITDHDTGASRHALFSFAQEELFREYSLIANRGERLADDEVRHLIDEHRNIDYFLIIKGTMQVDEQKQILETVKKIEMVSAAYQINVPLLKSRQNLIL